MGFAIGGAVLASAALSSSSAQNAANSQSQAADSANQTQLKMFNAQQANEQPYIQTGQQNLSILNGMMPDLTRQFSMNDFHQDPGYQFQLDQGTQAMDRSAAAKGMLNSAGTMEGINAYGQGMANTDYQQALTNFTNNQSQRYNMYAGMAGMGNTANGQMATVGMNTANHIGTNTMGAGTAQGNASIAQGNAVQSGVNTLANQYQNYNMMNNNGGGVSSGGGGGGWQSEMVSADSAAE